MTTEIDLNELEAIARAATPGHWHWEEDKLMAGKDYILWPDNVLNSVDDVPFSWAERLGSCGETTELAAESNAALIAAMNPETVLAMIALARRADCIAARN